jgi:hypothetical protein
MAGQVTEKMAVNHSRGAFAEPTPREESPPHPSWQYGE